MRVLEFNKVSKLYSLGKVGTGALGRDLSRWWQTAVLKNDDPYLKIGETNTPSQKGKSGFIWALQNINLNVNQGDVIGIIGRNGSGKSTLLKILSRITAPTQGEIRVKGKIASLLEVGTGFHPDLTGRENIYMNGAILGMTKQEINRKMEAIVDFSGIARHIDTPVKRYSSGMKVRLGFAVAAHLETDILIVDEVLAVGDADFQKKAIGKMQSVTSEAGKTVLFVSHNMNSVVQLCNRGIILDSGKKIYDGTIHEAVNNYISKTGGETLFEGIDGDINTIYLQKAEVYSGEDKGSVFINSKPMNIDFEVNLNTRLDSLIIGFNLYSQYDTPLARADFNDKNHITTLGAGKYKFSFTIPPQTLAPGNYRIAFDIAQRRKKRYTNSNSDLFFEMASEPEGFGTLYPNNLPYKNSIIRPDWFTYIQKL